MNKIEERAGNFADNFTSYDSPVIANLLHYVVKDGYIKGATDQLSIDTDKAVKAHCTLCSYIGLEGDCTLYEDTSKCEDVELIKQAMKQ